MAVANAVWGLRTAAAGPLGGGGGLPRSKRTWGIPARLARQGGEGAGRRRSAGRGPPIGVPEGLTGTQLGQWESGGC